MDPWSIAAVVGLVLAGKKLSGDDDTPSELLSVKDKKTCVERSPHEHALDFMETRNITPDIGRRIGDIVLPPKCEISNLQDKQTQLPFGQPVYNLYDRENISNKMNNVPPIERLNVGPGLGVDPNVQSTGGFQQYFRVLPNNPNDERLIQLKGTSGGPQDPVVKSGVSMTGHITQYPSKTYTYDPIQNSGQGQGGALRGQEGRPTHIKTIRPTIRQETGFRTESDDIQYGPSQYNVYQPYSDNSQSSTFKQLPRITDNRSKPDREANGQRMNVRANPLDAGGLVTNLRRELETNEVGVPNGSRFQQYTNNSYYKFNEVKSAQNPWTDNLTLAKTILKNNPIAVPALSS